MLAGSRGRWNALSGMHVTGIVDDRFLRRASGAGRQERNRPVKSALHSVLYVTPALVMDGVQIEHADQAGPLAAPVGDRQDRPAVGNQPGQYVVAILPDRFHNHQRRIRRNLAEYLHSVILAVDETVPLNRIDGVPAPHGISLAANGTRHRFLHLRLRGPAVLVGGEPQVSTSNQDDF